jgi:hypothetical protein
MWVKQFNKAPPKSLFFYRWYKESIHIGGLWHCFTSISQHDWELFCDDHPQTIFDSNIMEPREVGHTTTTCEICRQCRAKITFFFCHRYEYHGYDFSVWIQLYIMSFEGTYLSNHPPNTNSKLRLDRELKNWIGLWDKSLINYPLVI